MDWTKTAVVIRKRTLNETRDLALRIVCKEWKALAFYYALLAVPIYLLDLLFWPVFGYAAGAEIDDIGSSFDKALWCAIVYLTVSLETEFAGSLATQYLGFRIFDPEGRITRKETVKAWASRLPQLIYYLVVTRIFRCRYFYAEAILLELTPFWKKKDRISTRKRVANLNCGGVNFQRISTGAYLIVGVFSGYALIALLLGAVVSDKQLAGAVLTFVLWPLFLFGSRIFNVVYNFFYYVNHRVVGEGWDLVLTFGAESAKLLAAEDSTLDARQSHGIRRSRALSPLELENLDDDATEAGK